MFQNMDTFGIVGFIVAIMAVMLGMQLEGGHLSTIINLPAFIIVMGGSLGAVLLETPKTVVQRALKILRWIIFPPQKLVTDTVGDALIWSKIARKEGLLGLENLIPNQECPFTQRAIQLLVDGAQSRHIREILSIELESKESEDIRAASFFESLGGYCPTLGIMGAVLGLIHVMSNLENPGDLGAGIAVAFVATVYGVGLANVVFIPVAKKLKNIILQESLFREMVMEAVISISEGESPALIELKLKGYAG